MESELSENRPRRRYTVHFGPYESTSTEDYLAFVIIEINYNCVMIFSKLAKVKNSKFVELNCKVFNLRSVAFSQRFLVD